MDPYFVGMAKEVVAGGAVGAMDDDGPEEGEIEDDTSEEDGPEKKISSDSIDVGASMGMNYYQPPSSSKTEPHIGKSKVHSEDKKQVWRGSKRRIYHLYVDHDKPARDSYNRLTKSDLNSDHREINFHDLLKDYRTSKHGNEGNSHEKENRHFTKEGRTDTSRKREGGVIESQEEILKRSRKRKQHRSPSRDRNTSVSSDTDGVRKRKDARSMRPRRSRKTPTRVGNLRGSAALFAQIRASKLNALSASDQQKTQVDGVSSDIEITSEVNEPNACVRSSTVQSIEGKCDEASDCIIEVPLPEKGPHMNESSKSLCSASDSQTADRNEDSESKDEEDDVNQLRMLALQSAFRAKYLERKRRGMIVRKQSKRAHQISPSETNADSAFNLDDTADLLEAAVEAVSSSANQETPPSAIENWQPTLFSSLSEVPLPPDDPPVPSPVEDLTPVDMELALTDEEENATPCQNIGNNLKSDSVELQHPRLRTTRSSSKARSIPVTIGGRTQVSKPRKRLAHTSDKTRCNLLEVRTCSSRGEEVEDRDSPTGNLVDVNMGSMLLLDEVGTCSSPEMGPRGDDDHTLSEVSDTKSDLVPYSSIQGCFSGNIADDEDEELLRAQLLVEISRRHRGGNMPSNATGLEETKGRDAGITHSPVQETVNTNTQLENVMRSSEKSVAFISSNLSSGKVKLPLKRSVERTRRGQLLARVRNRQVSMQSNVQASLSPYAKTYLSKITSRGKYQRVNQNRLTGAKKRIDGNLHVTVMGSGIKSKSVSTVPQQQDRIVICLGEDSDESDDDRQNAILKRFPQGNNQPLPLEKPLANQVEVSESHAMCNPTSSSQHLVVDSQFPAANVSADFEKSVDRFLKEVRSGQESRLQDKPPPLESQSKSETIVQKKVNVPVAKFNSKSNVNSSGCRVISKTNVTSIVPKVISKSNAAPVTPKVAGNAMKAKPTKQIVKTGSGVTPQAVRHLPPPQQEEYRRLKMQISVLEELHKRRKAAEISLVSVRKEKINQGKGSGSTVPSSGLKLTSQVCPQKDSNRGGEDSPRKGGGGEPINLRITDRPPESVTTHCSSLSGDDVEEDVNLLREQLLRSRLQKKLNAMAETSAKISETSPAPSEGIILRQDNVLNSADVLPKLSIVGDNSACEEPVRRSSPSNADVSCQGNVTTAEKGTVNSSVEVPETALRTMVIEKEALQMGNSSQSVTSESAKCDRVAADAPKGSANVATSKAGLPVGELVVEDVSLLAVSHKGDIEKCHRVAEASVRTEGNSEVQATGTRASIVTPRTTGTGVVASSATFPLENQDTRASELAELELQLLSERHAALQYLSELSGLLSKMEVEGAHLRQKEIAAQKLRAELAATESAIAGQKDFLKQLALTISSTHERVTSTRQRCSMLCHACTKLGNQLKQDKRANGGQIGTYQVPTGGAALVKSQLSSVLWQTKQLKKSGLPFLRGQNFVASGKVPTAKRQPRELVAAPLPWSAISTLSLDSLKISSSDDSTTHPKNSIPGSSEIPGTSGKSPQVINRSSTNSAVSIPKTPSSSGLILSSAPMKVTPTQGATLSPAKLIVIASGGPVATTLESNGGGKVEESRIVGVRPLSEVPNVVTTLSSQSVEAVVSKAVNSHPAATEVILSGGQEPAMEVCLRDYHSPLEPITNRINAELASPANSSQQEESMALDPNVILCPYDLMGECQDEECTYQHQRRKGTVKGS